MGFKNLTDFIETSHVQNSWIEAKVKNFWLTFTESAAGFSQ